MIRTGRIKYSDTPEREELSYSVTSFRGRKVLRAKSIALSTFRSYQELNIFTLLTYI